MTIISKSVLFNFDRAQFLFNLYPAYIHIMDFFCFDIGYVLKKDFNKKKLKD